MHIRFEIEHLAQKLPTFRDIQSPAHFSHTFGMFQDQCYELITLQHIFHIKKQYLK